MSCIDLIVCIDSVDRYHFAIICSVAGKESGSAAFNREKGFEGQYS